jgi:hypothetical protein
MGRGFIFVVYRLWSGKSTYKTALGQQNGRRNVDTIYSGLEISSVIFNMLLK